jgi:hypothetical protein
MARPDWAPRFLEVFAATGSVRLAASAAGISRDAPYKRARSNPAFAARWERAREDATDTLEAEARRRGLGGSDQLLMFLLRGLRPATYGQRVEMTFDLKGTVAALAAAEGLDPAELLAEAEAILREHRP